jgi:membrane-associated progesterone receptor component
MSFLSSTLIPSLLSLAPLYLIYTIVFPPLLPLFSPSNSPPSSHAEGYNWIPLKAQECLVLKDYSPKTLEPFDGKDGGRILLAIKGQVFDVSKGRGFYGPGQSFRSLEAWSIGADGLVASDA